MMDTEQNAIDPINELMRALDSTWKGFASAFGNQPEKEDHSYKGSRPSQENAHAITRARSDPVHGDGASVTNQKDGVLALKTRPNAQLKSRSLSPDRCNRLSAFYDNLGIVDDVDNLEAGLARRRYEIAVNEVRAGEHKLRKCYDEVCILKRHLKKAKADKATLSTVAKVQAIEKKISARMDIMNKIDQQLAHERDKMQELSMSEGVSCNTDMSIPDMSISKSPRTRSVSPTRVRWHPSA